MTAQNKIYWSPVRSGFYDDSFHEKHQIPEDAIVVSEALRSELLDKQGQGWTIVTSGTGYPIAIEPKAPTPDDLASKMLGKVRRERAEVMSRLDGLQVSALATGASADIVAEFEKAKQALRDITKVDLTTYTTATDMRAAFTRAYGKITAKASADVRRAFGDLLPD